MTNIITEYEVLWKNFIFSLTEPELKQLMITFTNSLSTNQRIEIDIDLDTTLDLEISICSKNIIISSELFKDAETLDGLRIYFQDPDLVDIISDCVTRLDYPIHNEAINGRRDQSINFGELASNNCAVFEPISRAIYAQQIGIESNQQIISPRNYVSMSTISTIRALIEAPFSDYIDRTNYNQSESNELRIGGTRLDTIYGQWLNMWYEFELTRNNIVSQNNITQNLVPPHYPFFYSISNYVAHLTSIGIYILPNSFSGESIKPEENRLVRFVPSRRSSVYSISSENHYLMIRN